jgi:ABC-2 type transport system ATP-binding protein
MLDVSHLSRSYGDFKAVDEVSFSIGSGEIVGLLGHNGAGKTTIMKMLSGYLEADSGKIEIAGRDISTDLKSIQQDLGYLPESLPLYPEMTVADYLDYASQLKRISRKDKAAEIRRVATQTDLGDKINDEIATLSRGYKQRVGVAQAILGKPRLLIMDEPTNGLDPTQTDQMRQLMRDIAQDATVILSTHIMQEVEALCDRVLMMRSGTLAVDEKLANLQQSNQLTIETSLPGKALRQALNGLQGIGAIDDRGSDGDGHVFDIGLKDGAARSAVSAAAARAIIDAGGELYALQARRRDLESLFREVNSVAKEVSHAA